MIRVHSNNGHLIDLIKTSGEEIALPACDLRAQTHGKHVLNHWEPLDHDQLNKIVVLISTAEQSKDGSV